MRLCGGIEKWWFLSFSSSLFRSVSPILFLARCPSKPGSPCVLSYPYLHSLYFERSIYYFLNNYILFLPSLSLALAHSLPSSLPFLLSSSFILSLSFPPSPSLLSLSFSPSPSLPPSRLFRPPPPFVGTPSPPRIQPDVPALRFHKTTLSRGKKSYQTQEAEKGYWFSSSQQGSEFLPGKT